MASDYYYLVLSQITNRERERERASHYYYRERASDYYYLVLSPDILGLKH
jgi:hypothetical protein